MSQKLVTAKHSRCRPSETEITNVERDGSRETWTATCPAATVECTAMGYDREVEYRCVETPTPSQLPRP